MTLYEFLKLAELKDTVAVGAIIFLLLTSLIQIAPIRVNPWDAIFRWVGKKINGNVQSTLNAMRKDLDDHIVSGIRADILRFAKECREGEEHDNEAWGEALDNCAWYERYIEDHNLKNGKIEANIAYIESLYQELLRNKRIK